jgi:hypothetical protein
MAEKSLTLFFSPAEQGLKLILLDLGDLDYWPLFGC